MNTLNKYFSLIVVFCLLAISCFIYFTVRNIHKSGADKQLMEKIQSLDSARQVIIQERETLKQANSVIDTVRAELKKRDSLYTLRIKSLERSIAQLSTEYETIPSYHGASGDSLRRLFSDPARFGN